MENHHHRAEALSGQRILHIALKGQRRRKAGDIDTREKTGYEPDKQGRQCGCNSQGYLLREPERHIHKAFRGQRRTCRSNYAKRQDEGCPAEEHCLEHQGCAESRDTAAQDFPRVDVPDTHRGQRSKEGGVVDSAYKQHGKGNADKNPHPAPASVFVDGAACIGEIDILHGCKLDIGQPVTVIVEGPVERTLHNLPAVRAVEKEVAIEVGSAIAPFLDITGIEIDIVADLGVLGEIPIDRTDNQVEAPLFAEDILFVVGQHLADSRLSGEQFFCQRLGDGYGGVVRQSPGTAFNEFSAEHFEEFRIYYVYPALEYILHSSVFLCGT